MKTQESYDLLVSIGEILYGQISLATLVFTLKDCAKNKIVIEDYNCGY